MPYFVIMYNEIGRKIKFVRTKLFDYTQDYMAQRLNISQNAYCKIENGQVQPTYERLQKISIIFEMTIEDLINVEEKSQVYKHTNSTKILHEEIHNDLQTVKQIYEQLLKEMEEKYKAQIELLKLKSK